MRTLPLFIEGIDFYSNDYLGLSQSEELRQRIEEVYQSIGKRKNGATGSRLLSGNSEYAEEVEQKVAAFHKSESALIYSSGYAANLGLISSLATKDTTLIMDELVHASLIDGARLGVSKRIRFRHNDVEDLNKKLQKIEGEKLVIVESIYSMDGDVCPLKEVSRVCEKWDAQLIVDEAHSFGIIGEKGEGLCQKLQLENQVLARIMTFGKGPGIHGAAVVGPLWLKEYQVNFSRPFIFSTAPSPHHFASISAMYDVVKDAVLNRTALQNVIDYFIERKKESDNNWLSSPTQIQSLIVPGNSEVISVANSFHKQGIIALPIRKPSVAVGTERIRFCLHAFNTKKEVDLIFETLSRKISPLEENESGQAGKKDANFMKND